MLKQAYTKVTSSKIGRIIFWLVAIYFAFKLYSRIRKGLMSFDSGSRFNNEDAGAFGLSIDYDKIAKDIYDASAYTSWFEMDEDESLMWNAVNKVKPENWRKLEYAWAVAYPDKPSLESVLDSAFSYWDVDMNRYDEWMDFKSKAGLG